MKKNNDNFVKRIAREIFIDGLGGMATGLFATLIIGTIILQVSELFPVHIGNSLFLIGKIAQALTGAGIGIGAAKKLESSPLVLVSAGVAGMCGAFAGKLISGTCIVQGTFDAGSIPMNSVVLTGPGEPLGAFIAAMAAIYIGKLVSGKTKIDIIVTPSVCIISGSTVGFFVGPTVSALMSDLGMLINWGTVQAPFLMGIIVSVLMGIILTLPISSAALGIILGLSGISAGAAAVGCCANMVGFAVASYRENGVNGLLAQGLGTSMLQVGNIIKNPMIWVPAIAASAILGPISTCVLKMTNNPTGSGMGSAGLVGQINAYQDMVANGVAPTVVLIEIAVMHFILPAIIAFAVSEVMRKKGLIKSGDMKLKV